MDMCCVDVVHCCPGIERLNAFNLSGSKQSTSVTSCSSSCVCQDELTCDAGDVFMAAAFISYLGAFTGAYRDKLLESWTGRCKDLGIPVSQPYSLAATLSTPMDIREWTLQVCTCLVQSLPLTMTSTFGSMDGSRRFAAQQGSHKP